MTTLYEPTYLFKHSGAVKWTPWIVQLPVLEVSVERGCVTSPERPDRIASGIRFAADGGYSGPEYYSLSPLL